MPFFRTDPMVRTSSSSLPPTEEEPPDTQETQGRSVSMASSGVLGLGAIEVDPDTESEGYSDASSITEFDMDQLVREVSTVRRGQPQILRNPSQRKSVVPEVCL
jgi:hypothetical protein